MKLCAHIKPNSKHTEGVELVGDIYEIRVKAPAVAGKANKRAIEVLAKHFDVPKSHVTLVSGATSRYKVFTLTFKVLQ